MTFAPVSASVIAATSTTFTLTPGGTGDILLLEVITNSTTSYATGISSSNVAWDPAPLVAPTALGGGNSGTVFKGRVASTSPATVTITVNTGSPTIRAGGWEFSTTAGYASVQLDAYGTVAATTLNFPLLSPAHGAGGLYFGYAFNAGSATAGSTSGYTYASDPNGNGLCFDAACTSGAQQPVWGGTASAIDGIAVLLYEAPAPFTPARAPRGRAAARKARLAGSAGSPAVAVPAGYSLWSQASGAPATAGANQGTAGVHFTASRPGTLDGLWIDSPPGISLTGVPVTIALFNFTTQALIHSEAAEWTGGPGAGWLYAPFASPPSLAAGTDYMAAVFGPAGSFGYSTGYSWPASNGPLAAPADGQGYYNVGSSLAFPGSQAGTTNWNWWADVQFTPAAGAAAPFAPPAAPRRGRPAARKARNSAAPAFAAAYLPPPVPSPFTLPGTPRRARPGTRKGRAASSQGSPPAVQPSPFAPPSQAARGRPAARKGRAASSPGAPAAVPASPFSAPAAVQRARQGARRSRAGGGPGSPAVVVPPSPSPFTAPAALTRAHQDARRARAGSSPGSPAVTPAPLAPSPLAPPGAPARGKAAPPTARPAATPGSPAAPGAPSPFTAPAVLRRGHPAAARSRAQRSAGSPAVLPASPFAVPPKPARGRPAARRARASGSAGSPAAVIAAAFALPAALRRAHAAARKARLGSSAGAPRVLPGPAVLAPFTAPRAVTRGRPAARKGRSAWSAGSPATGPGPQPPGWLRTEDGGYLLAEDGGALLTEGYEPPLPLFGADGRLNLFCDLGLGGAWTDVTGYAYQRDGASAAVTVTRGRPDESATANPAACAWQWNNRDGRFSPRNPLSPYYGQLGRNTPVRWSVPAGGSYLRCEGYADDRASTPESSRLDIAGSIEMRIALRLTDWRETVLASKWDDTAHSSWVWLLEPDGSLRLWWADSSGTEWFQTSSQPVPFSSGDMALRVTMDAVSGTVTFYTAPGAGADPSSWAQLGTALSPTGGAATSIRPGAGGATPLMVGWAGSAADSGYQMCARVYEYRLYDGIGGTVAAAPVFTSLAAGMTAWADSAGNAWSLAGGAEISDRDYRCHGEMSALPPRWDVTGNDMWVAAQAGGPLRRLMQGTGNVMSAMKRAVLSQPGALAPLEYWPMEDAAGATSFGSAVGGAPMTFDTAPAPALATDSSFIASAPLPSLGGTRIQAPVRGYAGTGTWTVRLLLKIAPPAAPATLLRVVSSGPCPVVYVNVDIAGDLELIGYAPDGSEAFNTGYVNFFVSGAPVWLSVECVPVPGGVQYSLVAVKPGASVGGAENVTVSGSADAGTVSLVQADPTGAFSGTVMGHLSVQSAWSSLFTLGAPLNAWQGEAAASRYARLAGENGYQCRVVGPPAVSAPMGPQGLATLGALLAECEAVDMGQQFEPRSQLALGYRTLASMCGQAPVLSLDYAQAQPGGVSGGGDSGLEPTYDDQLLKNDWTVTRGASSGSQGATVRVALSDGSAVSTGAPPGGVGDYAQSATVNVQYDSQLINIAGWLVHTGTVDDDRWPLIPVNLARPAMAALQRDALALDVGDCLVLDNVPDTVLYDPVRQLMLGASEKLGGFHFTMEFNAVPESPYETVVLDDPDYGRADTDGSQLAIPASASATALSVATTGPSGIIWSPFDYPFDISVGGERMTVTLVAGTQSPQVFEVTRSVNGVVKSHPAGADVRLWYPPYLALS